jgi:hypothetical protein
VGSLLSSRWGFYVRRTRVEESLRLAARDLATRSGTWTLSWRCWGRQSTVEVSRLTEGLVVLRYSATVPSLGTRDVREYIRLERMSKPVGGFVWTFRCPLAINDRPCDRRVFDLYLPPGSSYFGCRTCHGLAYNSSLRRGDWMQRMFRKFGLEQPVW